MTDNPDSIAAIAGDGESPRILVIEDDPGNRKLIAYQLDVLGFAVEAAATAEEGLGLWRRARYQAILTDCELPGMSGYELAAAIRREERGNPGPVPIIALTGHPSEDVIDRCQASGMNECITKPVLLERLTSVLARWTGRKAETQLTSAE